MAIELLIARGVGLAWLICGLSHLLNPAEWTGLLAPLRARTGGSFILAGLSLPLGLIIVLGHNVWVWGLPLIVTVVGWLMSLKGAIYLCFPHAHKRVMPPEARMVKAIRIAGGAMTALGVLTIYDAYFVR